MKDIDLLKIQQHVPAFFHHIQLVDCTGSTNDDLKQLDPAIEEGYVLLANQQNNGKGRNGRHFLSPADNGIYMSFLLKPQRNIQTLTLLSIMVSCAVFKAIQATYKLDCQIKWVNDLMIANKKIAGILIENQYFGPNDNRTIIGIGINVHKHSFSSQLQDIATTIEEHTSQILPRDQLIISIFQHFYDYYHNHEDAKAYLALYRKHCIVLNKSITVITPQETYPAYAMDIDDHGGLIIKKDDKIMTLSSAEISIRNY